MICGRYLGTARARGWGTALRVLWRTDSHAEHRAQPAAAPGMLLLQAIRPAAAIVCSRLAAGQPHRCPSCGFLQLARPQGAAIPSGQSVSTTAARGSSSPDRPRWLLPCCCRTALR